MKPFANTAVLSVACASLAVSLFAFTRAGKTEAPVPAQTSAPRPPSALPSEASTADIEQRIDLLEATLGRIADSEGPGSQERSIGARLADLEGSIASLQSAFDGISLESASAERDALFRSEDGHLKADEYFAAEKFALAGEGYLKFLETNPDHPDAFDILRRARDSFSRAGYMDKAIWAQKELIKNSGEPQAQDLSDLANLEKMDGQYAEAAAHVAEAADMLEGSDRLWKRLYWAWYTQLGEGNDAGIAAYREVEQEINASGFGDGKLGERARDKIAELERLQSVAR